jgi:hypothetical protein
LETQGWQKIVDENEPLDQIEAVFRVGSRFRAPLESAGVDIDELCAEFKDVLNHGTQFISLSTLNYQEVWWKIFHSPDSAQWTNLLTLVKLFLSLPASNGELFQL